MACAVGSDGSREISLGPPESQVELRSHAFGWLPPNGKFTRFSGWMRYDLTHAGMCQMMLEIEAGSLEMSTDSIRDVITGPGMWDVARFPALGFHGTCRGDVVTGDLTMHGETHPCRLDCARSAGWLIATGEVRRADWGITGNPLIGGSVINITVRLPAPPEWQPA